MGESVTEGSITGWRKAVGDRVEAGEPLVDVTTDKVDVEVPAPASGTLARILVDDGASVAVGAALAEIDTGTDGAQQQAPESAPKAKEPSPPGASTPRAAPRVIDAGIDASPLARRQAYLTGTDLNLARGTGPGGVIRRDDVAAAAVDERSTIKADRSAGQAIHETPIPADATLTPLKGPAAALASYMEQSLSIPTATSVRSFAVDVMDARRREINAALKTAHRPEKISFTHLIAFAIVQAVKQVPSMAFSFRRDDRGPQRVVRGMHLGLAVDMQRKDGNRFLIVPVIRNADSLDFKAFHASYETLVAKARLNTLTPEEISGATMTLTNPGGIGTVASIPRLMPGQGTIVAAGAIGYPPGLTMAPEATLKSIGVSKVMTLTSTYDHRVIQGAESGEFLRTIEQLLGGGTEFYETIFRDLDLRPPVALATAPPPADARRATTAVADLDLMRAAAAGAALITRYRAHGHIVADLDPLDVRHQTDPSLDPATLGLTPELMKAVPAAALRVYAPGDNLAEVLERLRAIYCSTIAYEVEHITRHEQRSWLRKQIESGAHMAPVSKERRLRLLDRLTRVEAFERYLRKAFLGQKTFSIEGVDAMVPMMEEMLDLFAEDGVREIDLGMAHRGRLSVITHVVDRPYEEILREFEQAESRGVQGEGDVTGDVKYHQGAAGTYSTADGKQIGVVLANNPSHLEAVDGVVEGRTRASQTNRTANVASLDTRRAANETAPLSSSVCARPSER